jgi:hypothetical protein
VLVEQLFHCWERIPAGLHDVVTGSAMDVHVNKSRDKDGIAQIENLCTGWDFKRVSGTNLRDPAFSKKDKRLLDRFERRVQPLRCDYPIH